MKGKKILTGLLCAAVAGNLVAGVAPGRMCDVSAASAQTSIEQKKVVQTTKDLEQKDTTEYRDINTRIFTRPNGLRLKESMSMKL